MIELKERDFETFAIVAKYSSIFRRVIDFIIFNFNMSRK